MMKALWTGRILFVHDCQNWSGRNFEKLHLDPHDNEIQMLSRSTISGTPPLSILVFQSLHWSWVNRQYVTMKCILARCLYGCWNHQVRRCTKEAKDGKSHTTKNDVPAASSSWLTTKRESTKLKPIGVGDFISCDLRVLYYSE